MVSAMRVRALRVATCACNGRVISLVSGLLIELLALPQTPASLKDLAARL